LEDKGGTLHHQESNHEPVLEAMDSI